MSARKAIPSAASSEDDEIWSIAVALPVPRAGVTLVIGLAASAGKITERREAFVELIRYSLAHWMG